ncbi:MAG: DUF2752 domain-containing protein [Flavobacterium sp.]|jgi:hypothetical protein|nr:DUF2752 domain-containing protein [Flavobacterium sp.]
MSKNKLYLIVLIACFSGYLYLFLTSNYFEGDQISVCMIKNATGYPCPSCGTTRAIQSLFKGDFTGSLVYNPFGIILSFGLFILPFWISFDLATKRKSFYEAYNKIEPVLKQKKIAIPLIILVIINWIWNIYKEL